MAGSAGRDRTRIADDLKELGLPYGRDVLVHSSLRRIGPVHGGPRTMLAALVDIVGPAASVIVPTHTANNSTTSNAHRRATKGLTEDQRTAFENAMAGFDPLSTAS